DVGHPEVEAELHVLLYDWLLATVTVGRADIHAVLAEATEPGRGRGVTGRHHAALARGEELSWVKRERGQFGARADGTGQIRGPGGAGGVLDHGDVQRIAQGAHRIQVGGHSRLIDEDDRTRTGGQTGLHGRRSEVLSGQVHIAEHWLRAGVTHGVGRGDERQ